MNAGISISETRSKERIGPYTVLSHPLNSGIQYAHSRAANEEALICYATARSGARKHQWRAMAMLVSIGQSFLSISNSRHV